MTLGGLFRRKPKPEPAPNPEPQPNMATVLRNVRNHAAELRRQSAEIDEWLTTLKGHNHG